MLKKIIHRGRITVVLGLLGLGIWGLFVPLDSGVPSSGIVTVDGKRKVIQHPTGGVIREILVKEGDLVSQGSVLMRLESTHEAAAKSQAESQLKAVRLQIEQLGSILPALQELAEDGFYPRNQWLEMDRKFQEAIAQEAGLRDKLIASVIDLDRTVIRSPISGRIMGMDVNTLGAVITTGARIMDIVPLEEDLTIEAQVKPHLIDKILPGNSAQVRFAALQSPKTPVIRGEVQWVSADRFQNPNDRLNPQGYYLAKVIVPKRELAGLENFKIIPGMPADVIIKTGERTLFQYLFKPLTDRLAHTLKEY